eukprot:scaffold98432_cov33-Tisochrysis_lutea.AAC.1
MSSFHLSAGGPAVRGFAGRRVRSRSMAGGEARGPAPPTHSPSAAAERQAIEASEATAAQARR